VASSYNRRVLGARIEELLQAKSWRRRDLQRAVGVSQQTVSSWINGRVIPRGRNLKRLSEALDEDIGELARLAALASIEAPDLDGSEDMTLSERIEYLESRVARLEAEREGAR
jgi:transcriptional regulator with XRE-family HTH domain